MNANEFFEGKKFPLNGTKIHDEVEKKFPPLQKSCFSIKNGIRWIFFTCDFSKHKILEFLRKNDDQVMESMWSAKWLWDIIIEFCSRIFIENLSTAILYLNCVSKYNWFISTYHSCNPPSVFYLVLILTNNREHRLWDK